MRSGPYSGPQDDGSVVSDLSSPKSSSFAAVDLGHSAFSLLPLTRLWALRGIGVPGLRLLRPAERAPGTGEGFESMAGGLEEGQKPKTKENTGSPVQISNGDPK